MAWFIVILDSMLMLIRIYESAISDSSQMNCTLALTYLSQSLQWNDYHFSCGREEKLGKIVVNIPMKMNHVLSYVAKEASVW